MSAYSDGWGGANGGALIMTIVIAAVVLFLRNRKPRTLRLERLWVRPLISVGMVALVLYEIPPPLTAMNIALLIVGLVFGAALGWQRGRFMQIEVHPETHVVTARISILGSVFVLGLIALRMLLRQNVASLGGVSAAVATDALIVMAGAMMLVQQIEVSLRGRGLLAQAQAATAARGGRPLTGPSSLDDLRRDRARDEI